MKQASKHFFFEKKKQKTFKRLSILLPMGGRQTNESFFGSFFTKKEHLPC